MRVKNIFIKETSDNLAVLEEELTKPVNLSKEAIEMVVRTMHNIKGTAPMVGFTALPEIATPVEQAYKEVLDNKLVVSNHMVEKTKTAVSVIQQLLVNEESHTPQTEEEQQLLIDYFNAITG
ncbi:Hpt domain-containing protein [Carboxylicivirga mesophila]|uniref:Hpt domain-containing protein n=1 Tax=Carboxylicivirga mesophila TaxID=1166478 RepID=A0ABS5KET1_9BACT|nr:Hpt domain-containing protein [Carboxylicivirga mesophila]MBS2213031.1 Hpt domain-containing protein [Carboxylicivirga mesophila]